VLGIAMDGPETIAQVGPFARRYNLSFPVLLDEETKVVNVYNPKRTAPLSVLIDRKGRVSRIRSGYSAGDETLMEKDVASLVQGN
jgi:peroxiredoxin